MSLIEHAVLEVEQKEVNHAVGAYRSQTPDELTIKTKQVVRHESPMPLEYKLKKQRSAQALDKLLKNVIEEKGEASRINIKRNASNELEIEGMSKQALHNFLLQVEKLGKTITYTRTLKVEITNE